MAYSKEVKRVARRFEIPGMDRKDILQEAWILEQTAPPGVDVEQYIYNGLRKLGRDTYRTEGYQEVYNEEKDRMEWKKIPLQAIRSSNDNEHVPYELLEPFFEPSMYQVFIQLRKGLELDEIADLMKMSKNSVIHCKSRIDKVLGHLAALINAVR